MFIDGTYESASEAYVGRYIVPLGHSRWREHAAHALYGWAAPYTGDGQPDPYLARGTGTGQPRGLGSVLLVAPRRLEGQSERVA